MIFLTPEFWRYRAFISYLMLPLSWLYLLCHIINQAISKSNTSKVNKPVICIGNLTVGGAGKTPVALALADYIDTPAFITRGYGGNNRDTLKVDTRVHTATQVGDEALILAAKYPTWIGKNRYRSALSAIEYGAEAIIMDDGLQHLSLHQDCRFVVIDGAYGFGNEMILPAGPLREKIKSGLDRIDAAIMIGVDAHNIQQRFCQNIPVFKADFEPAQQDLKILQNKKIIAFAGIGRPQKFFKFLISIGCEVIDRYEFPDHHNYYINQLSDLKSEAVKNDAILVTTEKDYVRLPDEFKPNITMCRVNLKFQDPDKIKNFLHEKLLNAV